MNTLQKINIQQMPFTIKHMIEKSELDWKWIANTKNLADDPTILWQEEHISKKQLAYGKSKTLRKFCQNHGKHMDGTVLCKYGITFIDISKNTEIFALIGFNIYSGCIQRATFTTTKFSHTKNTTRS